ncbi:MAG TPA: hypothetical protein EYG03_22990 [Planctomycetes bacterium]|nr:hypothetical protein [Fuerstiella sp.]HIK94821.1 hypothetical protein [Planctomycetota bacterium]
MQAKLKKIQQAIESRDKLRQRIIERRVEELLDPNVNWAATSPNRNLPAPVGAAVDGPGPGVLEMPVTGTPIGLPGPPHIPFGTPMTVRSSRAVPATGAAVTWRQPSELYNKLVSLRRRVQLKSTDLSDFHAKLKGLKKYWRR